MLSFSLSCSSARFTNQQGEREADFINCVVWRRPAENVQTSLKKGNLAGVDGRIQTRNYEGQDGKRVYVTEVMAESVQFLEPKSQNQDSEEGEGLWSIAPAVVVKITHSAIRINASNINETTRLPIR